MLCPKMILRRPWRICPKLNNRRVTRSQYAGLPLSYYGDGRVGGTMSGPAAIFAGRSLLKSVVFVLCCAVIFHLQAAQAACKTFSGLIRNGGYAIADSQGRIVSCCHPDTPFIPASILKIATALAALRILGKEFRFTTEFFIDQQHNLYIKGYGDPMLTSEEVALILQHLRDRGVNSMNGIFIDSSSYALSEQPPGRGGSNNPYDAAIGAVAVNFNTVNIRVNDQGTVVSNEEQTPTLPLMKKLGRGLGPGRYRLNIFRPGCEIGDMTARHTAELFRALQRRAGISGDGPLGSRPVPAACRLVYRHGNSRTLEEMLVSSLKYSNNFIANQIFLACGTHQYGYPATWGKARRAVRTALNHTLGASTADEILMDEGSGLSRRNRLTARTMLRVLQAFQPYAGLLPEKKGMRLKSGTLDGVYNYAGYLRNGAAFVILLNQPLNTRDAVLKRFN